MGGDKRVSEARPPRVPMWLHSLCPAHLQGLLFTMTSETMTLGLCHTGGLPHDVSAQDLSIDDDKKKSQFKLVSFFLFFFLEPCPWHMGIPRLGVELAVAAGLHHSHSNARSEPLL